MLKLAVKLTFLILIFTTLAQSSIFSWYVEKEGQFEKSENVENDPMMLPSYDDFDPIFLIQDPLSDLTEDLTTEDPEETTTEDPEETTTEDPEETTTEDPEETTTEDPEETTTEDPEETTTEDPEETTTEGPEETTTEDPEETTTEDPEETTTESPEETTTEDPEETTTEDPEETTTKDPEETTTEDPEETTTEDPEETTTESPEETTTEDPEETTTEDPEETTTESPEETTTEDPEETTTEDPEETTTEDPEETTTEDPEETTTEDPEETTTEGPEETTTEDPEETTTEDPEETTTEQPEKTTKEPEETTTQKPLPPTLDYSASTQEALEDLPEEFGKFDNNCVYVKELEDNQNCTFQGAISEEEGFWSPCKQNNCYFKFSSNNYNVEQFSVRYLERNGGKIIESIQTFNNRDFIQDEWLNLTGDPNSQNIEFSLTNNGGVVLIERIEVFLVLSDLRTTIPPGPSKKDDNKDYSPFLIAIISLSSVIVVAIIVLVIVIFYKRTKRSSSLDVLTLHDYNSRRNSSKLESNDFNSFDHHKKRPAPRVPAMYQQQSGNILPRVRGGSGYSFNNDNSY